MSEFLAKSSLVTSKSSTISPLTCSSKYQLFNLAITFNTRRCESCNLACTALNTAAPCSIKACVVPTGALDVMSAIFSSLVVTTPFAALVNQPSNSSSTGEGWLNGNGMAILRISSMPGAPSISLTCVGSMVKDCPDILAPLSLSIVGALVICAESSKARNEPVSAADRPPIRCGKPIA